jgi:hypothetical protein
MPHDPEAMAQARDAFMRWAGKTGSALVEPGPPVASTITMSSAGTTDGPADEPINGWSVVEADDVAAAAALVADHPFISRGGVLQINEPAAI